MHEAGIDTSPIRRANQRAITPSSDAGTSSGEGRMGHFAGVREARARFIEQLLRRHAMQIDRGNSDPELERLIASQLETMAGESQT